MVIEIVSFACVHVQNLVADNELQLLMFHAYSILLLSRMQFLSVFEAVAMIDENFQLLQVSPYKKGLRNGPKALKTIPVIIRCK